MRAGDLRHQIVIQRYTETSNDFGEMVQEWATLSTQRASVNPISGKDIFSGAVLVNETTHKVFMRYVTDIKPNDRVLFDGRIFNITAVINKDEKNVSLELLCKEQF